MAKRLGVPLESGRRVDLTGITVDSRAVQPGDLYVAPAGATTHGARFASQAARSGAVAVLTDEEGARLVEQDRVGLPVLVVPSPRAVLGDLSAFLLGDPAADLRLLGVTGTQGKTTTTRLAEAALAASGSTAAVVGTVGTRIAGEDVPSALTTPEAPALHALFAVMREQGVEGCAMEVSSHAIVMGRVDGVVFDVAAFTNLGRDHLDFHADMDEYFEAKAQLFTPERARLGLVNADDPYGRRLLERGAIPMRSFGRASEADWIATDVVAGGAGSDFTLRGPGGPGGPGGPDQTVRVHVPLPGDFNVANAVCAIAGLAELGFDLAAVADGLGRAAGVPGRMEPVDEGQGFTAVVDYAHKPDAVEAVLTSLRGGCSGRLVIVIGAGGDRDRGKRPVMGQIAARLADVVVVTDDNPRSEDPAAIRAEVLAGAREGQAEVHEVGDRREAIRLAVSLARPGDCLVVAGKGHETGQEVDGRKHPFDDRDELRAALREVVA
ncbi:UDP-N-acetylmuramoyl-L-alanyl-D-glutamate--2,6-diaminopimelate ligase [Marmoricola bigeumensis]|uniref:UDP-N-acetylmuramoyl-L-alanyl-D-glutamate--2,6-diaminopimelate ligase n=1 Tax=Nocardioides marmoribigeumensis TaxID=433649 RepID=A0ABU2BSP3_9ACTN|nr:UDP-N-acetylmuramoyl-L-alanyl-D-glutamate--2,6-diaminopimelate ligase [Nocardioides marmoribigeumensis]